MPLIVAEGAPSRYYPLQEMMAGIRFDRLVDQVTALDLEALGVPVQWEYAHDDRPKTGLEQAKAKAGDAAAAVVLRALGRYGSPFGLPSLDQSDEHDDRWEPSGGGRLGRMFDAHQQARDSSLVKALDVISAERRHEAVEVAVVFGAAHMSAVVDCLTGKNGYRVASSRWLTVAHAPD